MSLLPLPRRPLSSLPMFVSVCFLLLLSFSLLFILAVLWLSSSSSSSSSSFSTTYYRYHPTIFSFSTTSISRVIGVRAIATAIVDVESDRDRDSADDWDDDIDTDSSDAVADDIDIDRLHDAWLCLLYAQYLHPVSIRVIEGAVSEKQLRADRNPKYTALNRRCAQSQSQSEPQAQAQQQHQQLLQQRFECRWRVLVNRTLSWFRGRIGLQRMESDEDNDDDHDSDDDEDEREDDDVTLRLRLQHFQSIAQTDTDFRALTAIRRMFFISEPASANNSSSSSPSPSPSSQLQRIFRTLFHAHLQSLSLRKLMLIHVSKSAGTSICSTMGGALHRRTTTSNCNLKPWTAQVLHAKDNGFMGTTTCEQLWRLSRNFDMIASERAMHGNQQSLIPNHCSQFAYLIAIRDPIERIASYFYEINHCISEQYLPTEMLVRRRISRRMSRSRRMILRGKRRRRTISQQRTASEIANTNSIADSDLRPGRQLQRDLSQASAQWTIELRKQFRSSSGFRVLRVNNALYSHLLVDKDYRGLIRSLFESEGDDDSGDQSARMLTKARGTDTYFYWLNSNPENETMSEWAAAAPSESESKQFAWKTSASQSNRLNVRFIRGFSSNIYTRFIGFEHRTLNSSWDAYHARTDELPIDAFINAARFLLKTDFVLPLKKGGRQQAMTHDIWRFVYEIMAQSVKRSSTQSQSQSQFDYTRVSFPSIVSAIAKGNSRNSAISWGHKRDSAHEQPHRTVRVSSASILAQWAADEREMQLLRDKNEMDTQLLALAQMIADADVRFYETITDAVMEM